jgi:hypothetical protein
MVWQDNGAQKPTSTNELHLLRYGFDGQILDIVEGDISSLLVLECSFHMRFKRVNHLEPARGNF